METNAPRTETVATSFPPAGGPTGPVPFGQESPAPKRRGRQANGQARGRRDPATRQEATIETAVVKDRVQELVLLLQRSKDASTAYSDGVKAAAEKAGLQASVVRKFIEARAGEQFTERQRDARQLVLLFDEVGE